MATQKKTNAKKQPSKTKKANEPKIATQTVKTVQVDTIAESGDNLGLNGQITAKHSIVERAAVDETNYLAVDGENCYDSSGNLTERKSDKKKVSLSGSRSNACNKYIAAPSPLEIAKRLTRRPFASIADMPYEWMQERIYEYYNRITAPIFDEETKQQMGFRYLTPPTYAGVAAAINTTDKVLNIYLSGKHYIQPDFVAMRGGYKNEVPLYDYEFSPDKADGDPELLNKTANVNIYRNEYYKAQQECKRQGITFEPKKHLTIEAQIFFDMIPKYEYERIKRAQRNGQVLTDRETKIAAATFDKSLKHYNKSDMYINNIYDIKVNEKAEQNTTFTSGQNSDCNRREIPLETKIELLRMAVTPVIEFHQGRLGLNENVAGSIFTVLNSGIGWRNDFKHIEHDVGEKTLGAMKSREELAQAAARAASVAEMDEIEYGEFDD